MRRELGSAFIHLWLSQNHKDIAKKTHFQQNIVPQLPRRAASALPKVHVKRQHGHSLLVQAQPKDTEGLPPWSRCWRARVLRQLWQFSLYPIKTPEACASSEYVSLLTDAREATFSMETNSKRWAQGLQGTAEWIAQHRIPFLACWVMKMAACTSSVKKEALSSESLQ